MLLGFVPPSTGDARIDGDSITNGIDAIRRKITYIPGQVQLYPELTGFENLQYFLSLSAPEKARDHALIEGSLVSGGLEQSAFSRPAKEYSKGMRQKVGVALSIAKQSKILVLDEPTTGLDPESSNDFSRLLKTQSEMRGVTVFMVTHDLFRAKQTGDRVGIMRSGRLAYDSPTRDLSHETIEKIYLGCISG
jgi:ABC-2 type transport system ATP-binding protein